MSAPTAAVAAVKAAKNVRTWGLFAALRYAIKNGSTLGMFDKALRFEERRQERARVAQAFAGYLA